MVEAMIPSLKGVKLLVTEKNANAIYRHLLELPSLCYVSVVFHVRGCCKGIATPYQTTWPVYSTSKLQYHISRTFYQKAEISAATLRLLRLSATKLTVVVLESRTKQSSYRSTSGTNLARFSWPRPAANFDRRLLIDRLEGLHLRYKKATTFRFRSV